ncbi:hypothetical protein [uncultured Neisseria sp.]|uniref:hypothetical protein n=1 Tax=uncultured Neisseria sp. TaxID=237778 RepID=UPI0025CDFC8C|nr:hypothetical protein [uncultured Neisseria sp.]
MAWRLYYTLEAAAEKLSKEFNDTYMADDLIHYAAIGLVELYINCIGREYYFAKRPSYDWAYNENESDKEAEFPEQKIYKGDFIYVTPVNAKYLEGGKESFTVHTIDTLAFIDNYGLWGKITADKPNVHFEFERLEFCLIPHDFLNGLGLSGSISIKREDLDDPRNIIRASKNELCIMQDDLIELQKELANRIKGKKEKEINDKKSLLNIISGLKELIIDKGVKKNQAEIIDYLINETEGYGISEANLKAKFAEANKLKKSN